MIRLVMLFASLSALACASSKEETRETPLEVARAAEVTEPYDLKLIDSMTRHVQDGIAIAQIAWRKSSHDELRDFTKQIVAERRADLDALNQMRDAWYEGAASQRDFELPGMDEGLDLSVLERASDEDVDRVFFELMNEHNANGIMMAEDALDNALHAALKARMQRMIEDRLEERRLLTDLREASFSGERDDVRNQ